MRKETAEYLNRFLITWFRSPGICVTIMISRLKVKCMHLIPPQLIFAWVFSGDKETNKTFVFLSNNLELSAEEIAYLYKNRWQVELFFKWIKQHLKIKAFWGTTENAVRIQIYSAIIAYCLVAIVSSTLKTDRSTYEILQILWISLLDKTPVNELFKLNTTKMSKNQLITSCPSAYFKWTAMLIAIFEYHILFPFAKIFPPFQTPAPSWYNHYTHLFQLKMFLDKCHHQ